MHGSKTSCCCYTCIAIPKKSNYLALEWFWSQQILCSHEAEDYYWFHMQLYKRMWAETWKQFCPEWKTISTHFLFVSMNLNRISFFFLLLSLDDSMRSSFFYTVLSFCGRSSLKSTQRDKNAKYFHRKFCVSKKSWFHIFFFFLCLFFSKPSSSMKINIIKLIFLSLTKRCKGHVESFFNLYWTHFIGLG